MPLHSSKELAIASAVQLEPSEPPNFTRHPVSSVIVCLTCLFEGWAFLCQSGGQAALAAPAFDFSAPMEHRAPYIAV